MQPPRITRHARQRLQQRGARPKEVAIVMTHGDIEVPARDGCHFIRLSHRAVAWLLSGGDLAVQDVDRAKRLMVLADSADKVVTVLKSDPERRFRGATRERSRR